VVNNLLKVLGEIEVKSWLVCPTGCPRYRSEVSSKREYITTEAGLYLQVSADGAKSWIFRFMLDGRAREMGLGPLHAPRSPKRASGSRNAAGCVSTGLTR
jgi:hypothetical protein